MSALAPDDPRHGTTTGYRYWRCRCVACREAATNEQRRLRAAVHHHPSAKVHAYTQNKAAVWVRNNRPELWAQFRDEGLALYGFAKVGRPPRRAS